MTRYLNIKTQYGVETIDSINTEDFKTSKEFRQEKNRLQSEYLKASNFYSGCYWSQRSAK